MIKERSYKKLLAGSFLIALFAVPIFSQSKCADNAKVVKPILSKETKENFEKELVKAEVELAKIRVSPDLSPSKDTHGANGSDELIWVGRRQAYLGEYRKAISTFTKGTQIYPKDARFYRHRGHRYITLRCFDDAINDFEKAADLIKGKPDEVEPDGLPNARNIPTSTLQSNIWYHLGLAYYLKGNFKKALSAYEQCLKVSKNSDMLVATVNWQYATLRRLGKKEKAERSIEAIKDDLDIIENEGYYKLVKVYQGKITPQVLLNETGKNEDSLSDASIGYGLGNWFLINGEKEKAKKIFEEITTGDQWSSFGYIAAEVELNRGNL
ncbi:MAG: tetratricopeptide repeat protein [Acidobacteria bacterium]|nr:tetratricopeptide repeat protein [Acidobacteriota bacterium]